jgi:hypothetical protein
MEAKPSAFKVDCDRCQATLAEYVRLELGGQEAQQAYPEITFHIEQCETCEAAYYREFRAQGQNKTIAALRQVGDRSQVETVMQQILASHPPPSLPHPSWRQMVRDYGRIWLEQETGRWRQLWLSLAALGNAPQKAPALTGMMGLDSPPPNVVGEWSITSPDANIEIKLVITADPTAAAKDQCRIDIALTLKDYFGDFSGVQITLLWAESVYIKETDAWGKASFSQLPCHQLPLMSLQIVLPD